MKHEQDKRKELLKKWKALPEPKDSWETFKRKNQTFKEYYDEQDSNVLGGTWDETETDLTVNINGKTGTISTVDRDGTPRPGDLIRIRVQMERLLRKMGVDVEAPGKQGDYDVKVIFPERKPKDGPFPETGKFRLTPRPVSVSR
jgi:hypothetical protein